MKTIDAPTLFISGDPSISVPEKAFFVYSIHSGKAVKRNQLFEVVGFDPNKSVQDLWNDSVQEIKQQNGIV